MAGRTRRESERIKLCDLSEEQVVELMDSVETDEEEDFSDDDDFKDPDYNPAEISPEDEMCISQCLKEMETTDAFIAQAVNMSLNLTELENMPSASSTLTATNIESCLTEETPEVVAEETVATTTQTVPSTSYKTQKRARSPLPSMETTGPTTTPSAGGFTGAGIESIVKDSKEFSKIIWRKQSMRLHVNEVAFRGDTSLPIHLKELRTPMEIFTYFFHKELVQMIVEETNRAAHVANINTSFKTTVSELYRYIGCLIYMSVYRYPNLQSYWGKNAFPPVQNTMGSRQFEAIKQFLSFRDESLRKKKGEPGYDPIFRIRNVANLLNERFDSVPKQARLCIDEQMCSTKMKHHLRQYMPNKPHKWGIKF